MLYSKKNYILMGISALLIIVGFILMSGGASEDSTALRADLFSARRIIIAPIICVLGFALMGYAILANPTQSKGEEDTK